MKAKLFKINFKDIALGSLMAFLSASLTGLYQLLSAGTLPSSFSEIKPVLIVGTAAFVAYIIKNFFTNSEGNLLKKENLKTK